MWHTTFILGHVCDEGELDSLDQDFLSLTQIQASRVDNMSGDMSEAGGTPVCAYHSKMNDGFYRPLFSTPHHFILPHKGAWWHGPSSHSFCLVC